MISAWWLILAFMAGAFTGVFVAALCSAGSRREDNDGQR